ncbi:MAG: hypothetical protein ABIL11_16400 [Chloroflexota bacterium]
MSALMRCLLDKVVARRTVEGLLRLAEGNSLEVAFPTRYFTRWSRRLQEFGFTPEDARVLALASFGSNQDGNILGMHWVATYDQPSMSLWRVFGL